MKNTIILIAAFSLVMLWFGSIFALLAEVTHNIASWILLISSAGIYWMLSDSEERFGKYFYALVTLAMLGYKLFQPFGILYWMETELGIGLIEWTLIAFASGGVSFIMSRIFKNYWGKEQNSSYRMSIAVTYTSVLVGIASISVLLFELIAQGGIK